MISRIHRFHGYGSLKYTYRKGETVRGPLCSTKYVFNDRRDQYRLAVVVNKKVNKSAVIRNKIRRQIYEVVRLDEDKIKNPCDIVITVFSDQILELSYNELSVMIKAQFKQAKII
ncbi:MAG TPA: ribonuclease P protein component [Candidatus Saccharimonadales bacterium]|jgi:ribonuclease P protein component|nr:ribonuclease P protein component [Candidatus Saccharimonadales bacterium]